jgi:hypothetical protein
MYSSAREWFWQDFLTHDQYSKINRGRYGVTADAISVYFAALEISLSGAGQHKAKKAE